MTNSTEQQRPPDTSQPQRTSNELVKLIRKLRWMGLEEEAVRLQTELTQRRTPAADSVVATLSETD